KLVAAGALALSAGAVQAAPVHVGGVIWDPDSGFDFTSNGQLIEEQLNLVPGPDFNNVLSGFGVITGMNNTFVSTFCPGCELTYEFGGYVVDSVIPGVGAEAELTFTGGWINFYVDHTPDYDANSAATAGSQGGENALWLALEGHDIGGGVTLEAELDSFGAGFDAGDGEGLLDVVGGLAEENFDTDSQTDGADFVFSSSFQPLPQGATPEGYELFGTADLRGESIPVPATALLLGLGLLGMGAVRKRSK
ncbi:MAG: PEP-CTERM sorting domain-containing protein, partial [Pseudomonadota bacterium]|nr:PEP-CTERM sorting domain-containing protein [Pseudomonadota bacterium]